MAPFSLMTASISWLAKSFSAFSCTSTLARCTSVLPAPYINPVKCLTSQHTSAPKRPLNGYLRFFLQEKTAVIRQHPEIKAVDVIKKIAQQWRSLSPEQKLPFEQAYLKARKQYKVDLQHYQAQLSPDQVRQQALEYREKMEKRKATRKKRELTTLGKPKRGRSPFNIFMAEHFLEAKAASSQGKLMLLYQEWKNLSQHQKEVYIQLAEDDKIRYKNEMKLWEEYMMKIGREDLLRAQTLAGRKLAAEALADKKRAAMAKSKAKKVAATAKSKKTV